MVTISPKGLPTKAEEAPSPHEVRLAPLDTNPVFQCLMETLKRKKNDKMKRKKFLLRFPISLPTLGFPLWFFEKWTLPPFDFPIIFWKINPTRFESFIPFPYIIKRGNYGSLVFALCLTNLIFGHLNINSLRNKFYLLCQQKQGSVDVFMISEITAYRLQLHARSIFNF